MKYSYPNVTKTLSIKQSCILQINGIFKVHVLIRIRVVDNKTRVEHLLNQYICSCVCHLFQQIEGEPNLFFLSSFEWAILVYRVAKSNVLMLVQEERGLDLRPSNISVEFGESTFDSHTSRMAFFTATLVDKIFH